MPRVGLGVDVHPFEDGRVLANNGRGRFVKREPFSPDSAALARYKQHTARHAVAR